MEESHGINTDILAYVAAGRPVPCHMEENEAIFHRITKGTVFTVRAKGDEKVGQQFEQFPAVIIKVIYEPKRWWQFWKRKKPFILHVEWMGE